MDDGHFYHNALFLNTQYFTKEDLFLLQKALLNLNIICMIRPIYNKDNQWRLFIPSSNLSYLRDLLKPFMSKSMYYKLGL